MEVIPMSDVTLILERAQQGDPTAAQELLPLVYTELRRIASHKMAGEMPGHTLQPTALVHEAWIRLVGNDSPQFANRAHFFASAGEAMRRILIESARRRARLKRGGNLERVDLDDLPIAAPDRDETLLAMDEALAELEKEDSEKAKIVKLKFFVGLTNQQVADSLGVTERTIERGWAYSKVWLFRKMREHESGSA